MKLDGLKLPKAGHRNARLKALDTFPTHVGRTEEYKMIEKKDKIILHLCADVGSDTVIYRENGYDVRCVGSRIGIENYTPPDNVYGIIANPVCTHFSIARSKAKSPRDLREGMRLVKECLRVIWECQYKLKEPSRTSPLKFWAIENPATGFLRWFLGEPNFTYCPSEYGEDYTKKTALWGMFNKPIKPLLSIPVYKKNAGNGWCDWDKRDRKRSICPLSFARAFYEANQ